MAAVDAVVAAAAAAAAAPPAAGSNDGSSGGGVPFSAYELSCYLLSAVKGDEQSGGGLSFEGQVLHPHTTLDTTAC